MAVIGINYEESNPDSFKGVTLSIRDTIGREFHDCEFQVGTPEDSFGCALTLAHTYGIDVICSSSVDHFIMDGGTLGIFDDA